MEEQRRGMRGEGRGKRRKEGREWKERVERMEREGKGREEVGRGGNRYVHNFLCIYMYHKQYNLL